VPTAALHETSAIPARQRGQPDAQPRIRVQMLNEERDLADVAHDLNTALRALPRPILFRRGRIPVYPDWLTDEEGNPIPALVPLSAVSARTHFSDHIEFWRSKFDARTETEREVTVTLSKSEAEGLLESRQLLEAIPEITAIHPRPLRLLNREGILRLLPVGYDPETGIYTYGARA